MSLFFKQHINSLDSILSLLNVKHTGEYTNTYFNEHPYKFSLFGLSKMLNHYRVYNKGLELINKENIYSLEVPFIAHIGNDFVAVKHISNENITYYWQQKKLTIPVKDFFEIWSGVVLVAEADTTSIEPDYNQHRKEEFATSIPRILLVLAGIVLIIIGFYQNRSLHSWGGFFLLVLNLLGVYISCLLVQKQINIHSSIADKICSLFSHSDCNDVLRTSAAKLLGIIGWSELGLGYFLSNTFLLLFVPQLLSYWAFLNMLGVCYSFWSIWYQKFRAKAWCPLCLIVQLIFWLLFITSLLSGLIQLPELTILDILSIALIYGIPFLLIHLLLPMKIASKKLTKITQQFNSLKMNDKVFASMLKEQTYYEIPKDIFAVIFGDPNAKNIITVFSNPHCGPCARMHRKIEKLLEDTNNQFRIQYILSSFNSALDSSCEFFLSVNKKYTVEERNKIYDEWFEKGKYNREDFFKRYSFVVEDNTISEEYQKHIDWKNRTKLRVTPTVIFDGYELPEMFFQEIDKLAFFTDLEIDPK